MQVLDITVCDVDNSEAQFTYHLILLLSCMQIMS